MIVVGSGDILVTSCAAWHLAARSCALLDDDLDVVADRLDTAIIKTITTRTTSKPASTENAAD
jgi:hypothetical protein